jgi:LPXTG-motif cell wall-anchored protein
MDASRRGRDDRRRMMPNPSTLYVVGFGLAVLAGLSWYVRRRK